MPEWSRVAIARSSSAEVIVTCPARNFVTLKIVTRSGVTGIGDATLNGRELAVASYLKDHLVPNLIGRDAGRIEDIWQFFYRGAYWRRGPVTMTAIAAVDVALWDILGKMSESAAVPAARRPLARRRAGVRPRERQGHRRVQRRSRQVHRARLQGGARAVRRARHQEGVRHLAISRTPTSRPRASCRSRPCGRRRSISTIVPKLFERLRKDHGPDIELLHDVHHRLTPIEAARLGTLARAVSPVLDGGLDARGKPEESSSSSASTR